MSLCICVFISAIHKKKASIDQGKHAAMKSMTPARHEKYWNRKQMQAHRSKMQCTPLVSGIARWRGVESTRIRQTRLFHRLRLSLSEDFHIHKVTNKSLRLCRDSLPMRQSISSLLLAFAVSLLHSADFYRTILSCTSCQRDLQGMST